MSENAKTGQLNVVCRNCLTSNRVPASRLDDDPQCGRCKRKLVAGEPVELDEANFKKLISKSDLPIVVDFWAPWCGPCKMMAPEFATAAVALKPEVILAKLNTQDYPQLATPFNIAGIPTMVLFQSGRETARTSGAMQQSQIVDWIHAALKKTGNSDRP